MALAVGRSIDAGQDGFVYRLNIEQFSYGGRTPTDDMLIMARWVLNRCMQADIERIALRSREAGVRFDLKVELDAAASVPATTSLLIDFDEDVIELARSMTARSGDALGGRPPTVSRSTGSIVAAVGQPGSVVRG